MFRATPVSEDFVNPYQMYAQPVHHEILGLKWQYGAKQLIHLDFLEGHEDR
jgi:hypothetical protein